MTNIIQKGKNILNKEDSKETCNYQKLESIEESTNNDNNFQSKSLKLCEDNNNNLVINDIKLRKGKKKAEKSVIISNNIQVIQVENWKKYNIVQNMDPNLNFMNENNNNFEQNVNERKKKQKDEVKCCLIS